MRNNDALDAGTTNRLVRWEGKEMAGYRPDAHRAFGDIETWRKVAYYSGLVLSTAGMALFLVPFVLFWHQGIPIDHYMGSPGAPFRFIAPSFIGFGVIFLGETLRRIGRRGLVGSGMILVNEPERVDVPGTSSTLDPESVGGSAREVVKVRCQNCGHLGEISDRYCDGCGQPI